MLYKSKYKSAFLRQIEYDDYKKIFVFKEEPYRKIKNVDNTKIFLCLERIEQKSALIKLLVDNQVGWGYEHHFEKI
jgi:hypothetical protein